MILEAVLAVLWDAGYPEGVEPGGFIKALLTAWAKADMTNRARLARAFPELAAPIEVISRAGGADRLRAEARAVRR